MRQDWAPERVWLQRGMGEEGSHTWCADRQGGDIEEVEYIRLDQAVHYVRLTGLLEDELRKAR
jgi:hypothetical protein